MMNPEVVVLSHGGARGYLYLGALCNLHSRGLLDDVQVYCGVGVGAIFSLLLTCGYTPDEISKDAERSRFFHDLPSTRKATENPIQAHLTHRVRSKLGFVPTLHQLYLATGIRFIPVSFCVDTGEVVYFSCDTHRDLDCIQAVILASHTPFDSNQATYLGKRFIDGMFGNPYPVDYFDNQERKILGMYIQDRNRDSQDPTTYTYLSICSPIDQLRTRISRLSSEKCMHLLVYCDETDLTGISWDIATIQKLLQVGYEQAELHLV